MLLLFSSVFINQFSYPGLCPGPSLSHFVGVFARISSLLPFTRPTTDDPGLLDDEPQQPNDQPDLPDKLMAGT